MNTNPTTGQATAATGNLKQHSFPRAFAIEHGVPEAVVAKFIAHKVRQAEKRKSKKTFKDGKYWFFDPISKVAKRFPYFERTAVADTLKRLETKKLIEVGNYNAWHRDQTRWYTVPQKVSDAVEKNPQIRFDLDVANAHGVCAGVLIAHMRYELIEKPVKDKKPLKDIYVPMSPALLARLIPFDAKTIRRTLDKLDEWIVKHPTRKLTYTLKELVEGTNPDDHYPKPDARVTKPDENWTEPDEKWTKPDDNTHYKPLETLVSPFGKPFKEEAQASPAPAFESNSGRTDDRILAKEPASPQPGHLCSPSSTGIKGCAEHATDSGGKTTTEEKEDSRDKEDAGDEMDASLTYDQIQTVNRGNAYYFDFKDKSIDWQRQPANDPGMANIKTVKNLCWGFIDSLTDATLYRFSRIKERDELVAQVTAQFLPYFESKAEQSSVAKKLGLWVFKSVFFNAALEFVVNAFVSLNNNDFYCMHSIENIWPYVCHLTSTIFPRVRNYNTQAWQQWLEARKKQFASVDQHRESDISLVPAEKARVLRNALQSKQQVGYLDDLCQHKETPITFSQADLDLAEELFKLNRGFSVGQLLALIDQCVEIHLRNDVPEGHDKHYHVRRGNVLGFFLKNASKIAEQLGSTVLNGWTPLLEPVKEEKLVKAR